MWPVTETSRDPEDRRLLESVEVTRPVARRLLVVSIAAFFGVVGVAEVVFRRFTESHVQPLTITATSPLDVFLGVAVFVALLVVVVVPHELLHGVFMARYGGTPEYGLGVRGLLMPSAYARTRGAIYTRNEMLVATLAPFVVITGGGFTLAVVLEWPLLTVPAAANAAGSVGDLWIAARIRRYPSSVRIAEPPEGYDGDVAVYGFEHAERGDPGPRVRTAATWVYGTAATLTLILAALFASVIASLSAGSGTVVFEAPVVDGHLFRHELVNQGAAVTVGYPGLFALSALGGVAWVLISRLRTDGS